MPAHIVDKAAHFWDGVAIADEHSCWEWKRSIVRTGYGGTRWGRQTMLAHRVAWTLTHGAVPDRMFVCHRCDNRKCCNPSHLFLGTNLDNMRDMVAKGRQNKAKGERTSKAKLTEAEVMQMRREYASGTTYVELAARYGMSKGGTGLVLTGRNWKHLPVVRRSP
jgi:hypothetical protein